MKTAKSKPSVTAPAAVETTPEVMPGISLRDHFAGQVIGKIAAWDRSPVEQAQYAYTLADALILERDRPRG